MLARTENIKTMLKFKMTKKFQHGNVLQTV